MRQRDLPTLIMGALDILLAGPGRTLRIVGPGDLDQTMVALLTPEQPLRQEMLDYSGQVVVISLTLAILATLAL
ncbi:MAG: hypothetical protein MO846_11090 [Candidatus Devosia symbiotica]|nr:hypothetical protein [Candidatus Devosia symbiotica]